MASPTNPAGTFDIGLGYGYELGKITRTSIGCGSARRRCGGKSRSSKEWSTKVTQAFALDFSVPHINVWGGGRDTQFLAGVTINTPHLHP